MGNAANGFTQKIVSKLQRIIQRIDELVKAKNQNANTTGKEGNANVEHTGGDIKPPVLPEIKPTPVQSKKTYECRYPTTPKWKTRLEAVGISAGIIYAVVTIATWWDLRSNFKIDERAWIAGTQLCRESPGSKRFSAEGCGDELPNAPSVVFKVVFKRLR